MNDLVVRAGRAVDWQWFIRAELVQRIKKAIDNQSLGRWQGVEDALGALGWAA